MTVFEGWVVKTVEALMRDARDPTGIPVDWEALERCIAIGLVQARALECRQIATSVLVRQPSSVQEITDELNRRSSRLEASGIRMAKTWPPVEEEEPEPGPRLVQ